jgi:hypothetical protein
LWSERKTLTLYEGGHTGAHTILKNAGNKRFNVSSITLKDIINEFGEIDLLKNGGIAYLSSVVKKRYGVYFYFKDGTFRLDPTHVREYRSIDEFVGLIASKGFEVIRVKTRHIMFPLLDMIIRLLAKFGLIKPDPNFFQRHKVLGKIRQIKVPIIGYKDIEVLVRKVE